MRLRNCGWLAAVVLVGGCSASNPTPYTSPGGNYKVTMPGKPEVQSRDIPSPLGNLKMDIVMATDPSKVTYSVMYSDYPEAAVQPQTIGPMLDGVASGFIQGSGFTEESTTKGTFFGHPGREVRFRPKPVDGQEGRGPGPIILARNRLYQVIAVGPASKVTDATFKAFFDSFSLVNKVDPIVPAGQ